jgi:hypothetical protein
MFFDHMGTKSAHSVRKRGATQPHAAQLRETTLHVRGLTLQRAGT